MLKNDAKSHHTDVIEKSALDKTIKSYVKTISKRKKIPDIKEL